MSMTEQGEGRASAPEQRQQPVVRAQRSANAVPKLCGADVELGNFILGLERTNGTGGEASRALLREVRGVRQYGSGYSSPVHDSGTTRAAKETSIGGSHYSGYGSGYVYSGGGYGQAASYYSNAQDWGRKFLPTNGGSIYIDLDHLELNIPEVLSAYDYVAAWHAMLIIAREAMNRANAKMPRGQKIQVLVNNSDGLGNAYGSHFNLLLSREAYDNIFSRKLHHLLYLASYLTSSILFTGAGKVGSENGRPPVAFQLSQRADFDETLTGVQTTYSRPLVNSRDEPLCGSSWWNDRSGETRERLARLHVIFFDNTLCPVACLLKAGVTQIVLAMIEQQFVAADLLLDDPLTALIRWSHDPSLRATARLVSRARYTALDMQEAILARAGRFVAKGCADGIVPRAQEIMSCWAETLELLKRGDMAALAPKLDWVLKRCIIERATARRGLDWASAEVKMLDQMYSDLDPNGIFWSMESAGLVQQVVSKAEVERFVHAPPDDTRAWLRAQLLRMADPATIDDVDWDVIRFRFRRNERSYWPTYSYVSLAMSSPLRFTRDECASLLDSGCSLQDILKSLGACETDYSGRSLARDEGTVCALSLVPVAAKSGVPTDGAERVPTTDPVVTVPEPEDRPQAIQEGEMNHGTA